MACSTLKSNSLRKICLFLTFLGVSQAYGAYYNLAMTNEMGGTLLAREQIVAVNVATQLVSASLAGAYNVFPGDLNADSHPDIVVAGYNANSVVWYANGGDGLTWATHLIASGIRTPTSVKVADINNNGTPDVAACSRGDDSFYWWNNVDGTGTNWQQVLVDDSVDTPFAVAVGDINGNGRQDLAGASYGDNKLVWWSNDDGAGLTWSSKQTIRSLSGAIDVALADVDGDGDQDVVAAGYNANEICWIENADANGNGTVWSNHTLIDNFAQAYSVFPCDLDADGHMDVVACAGGSGVIRVWRNGGGATSWVSEVVASGFASVRSVWASDFDQDGDLDIAAAAYGANSVAWWEQRADGWVKWTDDTTFYGARSVCAADVNNDGRDEIVGASLSSNQVAWWANSPVYGVGAYEPVLAPVSTARVDNARAVLCVVTGSPRGVSSSTQLVCQGWTGSGSVVSGSGTNSGALALAMDSGIGWNWSTQVWLEVRADDHGLVNRGSAWYDAGSMVSLQAVPTSAGYQFINWSGVDSAVETNNPLELTMDQAHSVMANFGIEWVTITASNGANGLVSPSGSVVVAVGSTRAFNITPDPGYKISRLFVNGESNGVSDYVEFVNVLADNDFYVEFEQDTVALKVASLYGTTSPDAGKISFYGGGSTVICSVVDSPVSSGAHTQFVCTGWTGSGSVSASGSGVVTPGMVLTEYSTIDWQWKTQSLFQVNTLGAGTTDVTSAWVDLNGEVQVWASAETGHVFTGWSGDVAAGSEMDNPLTIRLDHARTITASFAVFRPVIHASAGNNGVIRPAGSIEVDYGATPSFEIVPDTGYRIKTVTVDGSSVGVSSPYTFSSVMDNHSIVAVFTDDEYDLAVVSTHGTASPAPGTNIISAGETFHCEVTGSPESGGSGTQYVCTGWSGGGNIPASGTTLQTPELIMRSDSWVHWLWTTQHWISVTSAVGGSVGYTNGWQNSGAVITLMASAQTGYYFTGWVGDTSGIDTHTNPLVLLVDEARALQAEFQPELFTIVASSGGGGSISPVGHVEVAYGQSKSFLITPNAGYRVSDVLADGISVGAATSHVFSTVVSNHTLAASFALDVYTLTVNSEYGVPEPAVGIIGLDADVVTNCVVSGSPVLAGSTQHVCTGWTGTGSVPATGTRTNIEDFVISSNSSVTWNWRTFYWLNAAAADHGSVTLTGGWYQAGTTNVTVDAVPGSAYRFAGWSGDVPQSKTNDNPLLLDMTQARFVTAHFNSNTVLVTSSITGAGSVTPSSVELLPGSDATFRMAASSGSRIRSVMVDSNVVAVTNYYLMDYTMTNLIQDHLITVAFGNDDFDLTIFSEYGTVNPTNGTHTYAADQSLQCSLLGTPSVTASGRTRRVFTYWSGTGSVPASGTDTNVPIIMNDISSITWNWKTQHLMRVSLTDGGSVDVPTNGWYDAVSQVVMQASSQPLNRFVRWSGDVPAGSESNNPLTVSMDVPRDIRAVFAADFISLTVNSMHGDPQPAVGISTFTYGTNSAAWIQQSPWPSSAIGTQYACRGWSGSGAVPSSGSATNTGLFSLTTDSVVTWLWQTNYELSVASVSGGSVVSSGRWHSAGGTVQLEAVAATGYVFSAWSGDVPVSATYNNPLQLTMDRARLVVPGFVTNRPLLMVNSTLDVVEPAVGVYAGDYARVTTCSVISNPVVAGTTRYMSEGWTGTGSVPATGTLDSVDVLMTNHSSITWLWQRQFLQTATGGINGFVTPSSSWHDDGSTNVQVLAVASTGYQFAGWSGDIGLSDTNANPILLTMDRARNVQAQFEVFHPPLTVINSQGECSPVPGTHTIYQQGMAVDCLIYETPYPTNPVGTQYVCQGWSGSGSVPISGTDSYVRITLNESSSIAWNWKTQFWLQVSADSMGSVAPTGGWYDAGSMVTVTPVAVEAHCFSKWIGDLPSPGATSDVPLVVTMNQARVLSAVFMTNQPVLQVISDYGTANPSVGSHIGAYARTEECSVDCGPIVLNSHTQIVQRGWTGSGSVPSNGSSCFVAVTLTNDSQINWLWYPQYSLNVTSAVHGAIVASNGWHDAGSNVVIKAVPDEFYRFTYWSGSMLPSSLSNQAEIVLGMTGSYDLMAHYSTNNIVITSTYEGDGCGTLSPTGTLEVAPHGDKTFTITPADHCHAYLVVDGVYIGITNSYTFTNLVSDHTLHAVFEKDTEELTVGSTYQNGRFSPPVGVSTYEWGSNITCQVTNSPIVSGLTRYVCTGWQGSGSVSNAGTGLVYGPFSLETNSTIIWEWGTNFWLDITSTSNGSVNMTSGWYTIENVSLIATPEANSHFIGWRGDTNLATTISSNEIRVKMDQPRTIEAVFSKDQYNLTIASDLGMCVPPPGTYAVDHGTPYVCYVTNSPYEVGVMATQYVCTGSDRYSVVTPGTQATVLVTNNVTLTWQWQTNFYLDLEVSEGGVVTNATSTSITNGWVVGGADLALYATASNNYAFDIWSGDLHPLEMDGNRAILFMKSPRRIQAFFSAQFTTNRTPYWWLEKYGITNDYENAENQDQDGDGFLTWQEWVTATDPTNALSFLRVESIAVSGQSMIVSWSSETNRIYQVIRGTSLMVPFEIIASNITATTPETFFTDTNRPAGEIGLYSVEALRPDEP